MATAEAEKAFDWEAATAHERNLWVHGRVFGRRVLSALEMAEEAASVRKQQPGCVSFLMGFVDTGDGFRQHVPSYTTRADDDLRVLDRVNEMGLIARKKFGDALWAIWSQRALEEVDSRSESSGLTISVDLWVKATQYRPGDYSKAAYMALSPSS